MSRALPKSSSPEPALALHRLRELAAAGGWTGRSLAAAVGITPGQLSNFLAGRRALSQERLDDLFEVLGLSAEDREQIRDQLALAQAAGDRRLALESRIVARREPEARPARPTAVAEGLTPTAVALRELLRCPGVPQDPATLSARLRPSPKEPAVREALRALEDLGLLSPDPLGVTAPLGALMPPGWLHEIAGWGLGQLQSDNELDDSKRYVKLLVQAVPTALRDEVHAELGRLSARLEGRVALAHEQPTQEVQALVVRWAPVTAARGEGAPRQQEPSPPEANPLFPHADYRAQLDALAARRETWLRGDAGKRGALLRKIRRALPAGETLSASMFYAILRQDRHVPLNHVEAWVSALKPPADGPGVRVSAEDRRRAAALPHWLRICVEHAHASVAPLQDALDRERLAVERSADAVEIPSATRDLDELILAELACRADTRADPDWLAAAFDPPISAERARAARDRQLGEGWLVAEPGGRLWRRAQLTLRVVSEREARARVAGLVADLLQRRPCTDGDRGAAWSIRAVPAGLVPRLREELDDALRRVGGLCDQAIARGEPVGEVLGIATLLFPVTR